MNGEDRANEHPPNQHISSPSGIAVGSSSCTYLDRAFMQFAGFTFGKTQSYFDFFNTGAYSLQTNWLWVDSGGSGTPVFAYTWQGGNGLSATISAEDATEQRQPVVGFNPALAAPVSGVGGGLANTAGLVGFGGVPANAFGNCNAQVGGVTCDLISPTTNYTLPIGGTPISSATGQVWPDIVANVRVDQAWGSAQVMGAIHRVAATYYAASNFPNTTSHPKDEIGWAGGGGITLNMPWDKRDTVSGMVNYCVGAVYYCSHPGGGFTGSGSQWGLVNTSMIGLGWQWDAMFNSNFKNILAPGVTSGNLELSKSWSFVAAFEHYWTPTLRSSVYGGYEKFQANSPTVDIKCTNGSMISNNVAAINPTAPGSIVVGNTGQVFGPGCLDWSAWELGTRSIWNPVANLDIGVDVMYTKVNTALANAVIPTGGTNTLGTSTGGGAGLPAFLLGDNTHIWSAVLRIQRNFWP